MVMAWAPAVPVATMATLRTNLLLPRLLNRVNKLDFRKQNDLISAEEVARSERLHRAGARRSQEHEASLYGDGFGQVPRLIHISAFYQRHMITQQLQRNRVN